MAALALISPRHSKQVDRTRLIICFRLALSCGPHAVAVSRQREWSEVQVMAAAGESAARLHSLLECTVRSLARSALYRGQIAGKCNDEWPSLLNVDWIGPDAWGGITRLFAVCKNEWTNKDARRGPLLVESRYQRVAARHQPAAAAAAATCERASFSWRHHSQSTHS